MNIKLATTSIIAFFLMICLGESLFVVHEANQAIILQFGEIVSNSVLKPGLHYKIPVIQKVLYFDSRILNLSPDTKEVIAFDQKRVEVGSYVKYRIVDPLMFFQTVKNERNFSLRLSPIIESNIREQVGKVTLLCLLNECRSRTMDLIYDGLKEQGIGFGVDIIDFRICATDLPETNSEAIFHRMQTEREKEAREIKAEGLEEANRLIAGAEKEKVIIVSDAERRASILMGEGEAEAMRIYNEAASKDRDFFNLFLYSQFYNKNFKNNNTKILLSPESQSLKYFNLK